jgi:tetratricopeptide (TPR) repeat protein
LDDVIVTNGYLSRYSSDDIGGLFYANLLTGEQRGEAVDGVVPTREIEKDMLGLVRSGTSVFGKQRNRCYLSIGKLGFANFSGVSGVDFLDDARAVATTDWDHDGDIDVIMTSRNGPQLRILSNENNKQNGFLHFKLIGTTSNRDAIGARIELFLADREAPLVKFVSAGSGNLSQSSKRLFFGLGDKTKIEKAVVTWPDGQNQTFENLISNTRYVVTEGDDKLAENNNGRFELVLERSNLDGEIRLPPVPVARFRPESWLPNIEYIASDNKCYSVSPVNNAFTTVVVVDDSPESIKVINAMATNSGAWEDVNLDAVLLFADREAESDEARLKKADHFFSGGVPFRWGAAPLSSIQKLEYYCGHWFSNQQLPRLPFALSMTPYGQIASFHYLENAGQAKDLAADLAELAGGKESAEKEGRGLWVNRYRTEDFSRLITQFRNIGMERTANEMFFRSRPHMASQLTQHATELTADGDVGQAMKFYDRALKLFGRHVPALVGRGNLISQQALAKTDGDLALRIQQLDQSAASYSAALALDPFNTEAILGKSKVLIEKQETSAAIEELAAYLQIDPTRAEVHAMLGRLYFTKRDFNSAAKHLLIAYELRPTLPYVAGDLGYLYLASGQAKLGRKFLRLSHRLQPSDRNVLKHLAEAEFTTGNFSEAVELLTRTVKLHPNHRRSKQLLAWLLATSPFEEDRNGGQGQKLIKPLVTMMGDRSPTILEVYAACFAETGDFDQAVRHQEKAIELIRADKSEDRYSETQKSGMVARLELYSRKRPYRTADIAQIPIKTAMKVK